MINNDKLDYEYFKSYLNSLNKIVVFYCILKGFDIATNDFKVKKQKLLRDQAKRNIKGADNKFFCEA